MVKVKSRVEVTNVAWNQRPKSCKKYPAESCILGSTLTLSLNVWLPSDFAGKLILVLLNYVIFFLVLDRKKASKNWLNSYRVDHWIIKCTVWDIFLWLLHLLTTLAQNDLFQKFLKHVINFHSCYYQLTKHILRSFVSSLSSKPLLK